MKKKSKRTKQLIQLIEEALDKLSKQIPEAIYKTKCITDITPDEFKKGEYK